MKTRILRPILLFFFILTVASSVRATVFFVSTSGNDNNDGAENSPFATIQKAVNTAQAGDTVKVLAGIYVPQNAAPYRGMIVFKNSGTPEQPITFEAVGDVRISGTDRVEKFSGIFEINGEHTGVEQIHDIVIRGFRLENSAWFGIKMYRAKNIIIENNYTFNTGSGGILALQSQNITVRGNTLERACISPDTTIDTQEIISLSDVDGFEIDRNHVFNGGIVKGGNGGEGIDAKTGSRNGSIHHNTVHDLVRLGIYVDSWDKTVENINVYGNRVYNCAEGITISSENGGTARKIGVFNNIVYNNKINGINISSWVKNGVREDIQIINNVVYHNGLLNGQEYWGGGISVETANAKNVVICQNIVSQNKAWQILINRKAAKISISNNLVDGFRSYTGDEYLEQTGKIYFSGDPQFTDPSSGNFKLKLTSPALKRSNNLCLPETN